jgi:hypothetical protein
VSENSAEQKPVPKGAVAIPVGNYVALVDATDGELVRAYRWRPKDGGNIHGEKIYAVAHVGGRCIWMHRLIAGTPAGLETDHANGDSLDNRRGNLRPATRSQNLANRSKPRRSTPSSSSFKGVYWDRPCRKWRTVIRIEGRSKHLGRYDSEIDAARAYDVAALAAWGEFAKPNFPNEVSP